MKLQFILRTAGRGVLINSPPLLLDIDKEIDLSFVLSSAKLMTGDYYVILTDKNNVGKAKFKLDNGRGKIPQGLMTPQTLYVMVIQIDKGKLINQWICSGLKLTTSDNILKLYLTILPDITQLTDEVKAIEADLETAVNKITALETENISKTGQITTLETALNETRAAYKALQTRIEILENN